MIRFFFPRLSFILSFSFIFYHRLFKFPFLFVSAPKGLFTFHSVSLSTFNYVSSSFFYLFILYFMISFSFLFSFFALFFLSFINLAELLSTSLIFESVHAGAYFHNYLLFFSLFYHFFIHFIPSCFLFSSFLRSSYLLESFFTVLLFIDWVRVGTRFHPSRPKDHCACVIFLHPFPTWFTAASITPTTLSAGRPFS